MTAPNEDVTVDAKIVDRFVKVIEAHTQPRITRRNGATVSTATATKDPWVIVHKGSIVGEEQSTRSAARDLARNGMRLEGFKIQRKSEVSAATKHAKAKAGAGSKPRKASGAKKAATKVGGYVPATRRKCADCGHYRKREEQKLVERPVTFDRGGKSITQTRKVAICKDGCRENTR